MRTWGDEDIYGKLGVERPFGTNLTVPVIKPGKSNLEDYSGPLQPRLSALDLSKDCLVRMNKELGREAWGLTDGLWGNRIAEKYGARVACAVRDKLWDILVPLLCWASAECFNFRGTAVEKMLKQMQANICQLFIPEVEVELISPNAGIATYRTCPSKPLFEKWGQWLMLYDICWKVDPPAWVGIAKAFHPQGRMVSTKLPPTEGHCTPDKYPCACSWAFWVGDIKQGDTKGYVKEMNKRVEAEGADVELEDYSGPLHRRIVPENFSREMLAKCLVQASRFCRLTNALYCSLVTEAYGDEVCWEMQEKVFEDQGAFDVRIFSRALNLQGSPVEKALKCLQMHPWWGMVNDVEVKLKDQNEGSMICYRCSARDYYEGVGGESNMCHICGDTEQRMLQKWAQNFDPKMEVTPVVLPPKDTRPGTMVLAEMRSPREEGKVLCEWKFRLPT